MSPLPPYHVAPPIDNIDPPSASHEENAASGVPLNEGTSHLEDQIPVIIEPHEPKISLRRSSRDRRPNNFDDYMTYLNEADMDL